LARTVPHLRDINENTLIELDRDGKLVSMTIEHAKKQANMDDFSCHQVVSQKDESAKIYSQT
jgi:uncharacterized protein YuzE